jgi:hypothetical protein
MRSHVVAWCGLSVRGTSGCEWHVCPCQHHLQAGIVGWLLARIRSSIAIIFFFFPFIFLTRILVRLELVQREGDVDARFPLDANILLDPNLEARITRHAFANHSLTCK